MAQATLSIATFNVNSIRARLPAVLAWLAHSTPDIALLQELKCTDDQFPALELEDLGYNCGVYGEKTYNGVAILSKFPLDDVTRGLPNLGNGAEPQQARYIEALATTPLGVVRVASVYVPNGQEIGSEKFHYKLAFLEGLRTHLQHLLTLDECTVIGGDYNVAPEALDVFDAAKLHESLCFHPEERKRFRAIMHMGYSDAFRQRHPQEAGFTWWDYRGGSFERNLGLRIDHLLLSPPAADRLVDCRVEQGLRAADKASDHAPVVGIFAAHS